MKKGLARDVQPRLIREPFNNPLPLRLYIGEEARRLTVKTCAAPDQLDLADSKQDVLDVTTRSGESSSLPVPVKMVFSNYVGLDKRRPPLSHVVFVEGETVDGRCYGVVQFFGTIQLYVVLNPQYSGKSFSRVGFVNRHLGIEHFDVPKLLYLHEVPET
jgi:hypothetical protein